MQQIDQCDELDDDVEDERDRFLNIIKNYKINTQGQFVDEYYKEYGEKILQSVISKRFTEFNISKVDGIYDYTPPEDDKENAIQYLLSMFCENTTKVKNTDFYSFRVSATPDNERLVCKIIYDSFQPNEYFAIIPAYGYVAVLCRNKANANKIRKFLIENKNYEFPD